MLKRANKDDTLPEASMLDAVNGKVCRPAHALQHLDPRQPSPFQQATPQLLNSNLKMIEAIGSSLSSFQESSLSFPLPAAALWLSVGLLLHLLGSLVLLPTSPASVTSSASSKWKWQSTYLARNASALTGIWALTALYTSPEMRYDLMFGSSSSGECLLAFSIGVHLAEAVDMVWHMQLCKLLIHHVFVVLCFIGALLTGKAVGFGVLTLATEVSMVFLKTRRINVMTGLDRASKKFQLNARINLATLATKVVILSWMNYQSFLYFGILPLAFLLTCNFGLLFVNFWSISIFNQLVVIDLLKKTKRLL